MPEPVETALGRMHQSIEDIKVDILEIKEEQRKIVEFVTTQRAGLRLLATILTILGTIALALHEEILKFFGLKLPN